MTTVINNPGEGGSGVGVGMILGILVVVALVILFFVFGVPYLRGQKAPAPQGVSGTINVGIPTGGGSSE